MIAQSSIDRRFGLFKDDQETEKDGKSILTMVLEIPTHAFRGYIFDCDGTIADTMPLHFRAWTRAMEELGGKFPEELFYAWGGTPARTIIGQLNEKYGLNLDPESASLLKEQFYGELIPEVMAIEPVVALVKKFHDTAPLAVASGGLRSLVTATLDALKLTQYFEAIVTAEDTERHKPFPDPFLEAARRLGIDPADCLVFEDAPAGIQAAKAAGMHFVHVPSAAKTTVAA